MFAPYDLRHHKIRSSTMQRLNISVEESSGYNLYIRAKLTAVNGKILSISFIVLTYRKYRRNDALSFKIALFDISDN